MKKIPFSKLNVTSSLFILILITSCSQKQNWPQFRGSESNMITSSKILPEKWGNDSIVKWTCTMEGASWSSPIVWGNKVFITSCFPEKVNESKEQTPPPPPPPPPRPSSGTNPPQGQNPPTPPVEDNDTSFKQEIYRWEVKCIDLNSGKELWKQIAFNGSPRIKKHSMNNYATETPVTDGKRLYAYFGMHGLYCYDLNGNLLWQKDLGAFKTQRDWGTGSSPIIFQDILYIQVDNEENSFITALDPATGNEMWKNSRDEKTNYSTPFIWKNKTRNELIVLGKVARSYNPKTGKLLWEIKTGGMQSSPSPVADKENLYFGNADGRETKGKFFSIIAGAEGDISLEEGQTSNKWVKWSTTEAGLGNSSPLLLDGLIYAIGGRGEIRCLNAADGKLNYKEKLAGVSACWASPWAYNNKIWFIDDKGITRVFRSGEKFEFLFENKLKDKIWASVAITKSGYIFKGVEKLYCVQE
ncbi:MAG: PQQ-binding-like beta-propeller repeat protein [Tenuifilaceae bacterium]